jgi:hypothetical protein
MLASVAQQRRVRRAASNRSIRVQLRRLFLAQILADFLARVPRQQLELMRFPDEPEEYFGWVATPPPRAAKKVPLVCLRARARASARHFPDLPAALQLPRAARAQVRRGGGAEAGSRDRQVAHGEGGACGRAFGCWSRGVLGPLAATRPARLPTLQRVAELSARPAFDVLGCLEDELYAYYRE